MRGRLVLLLVLLAACRPEGNNPPSVLDVNPTVVAGFTQEAVATRNIAPPTPIPVETDTPSVNLVTPDNAQFEATATLVESELIGQSIRPSTWQTAFFIDTTNTRRNLSDLTGKVVVLQTLSTLCDACVEQTVEIADAAQQMANFGNTENIIFLSLSTSANDSIEDVINYQVENAITDNPNVEWIGATASRDLIRELENTFGENVASPFTSLVIFLDSEGVAHLSSVEGRVNSRRVQDIAIELLLPFSPDEVVTEEPTDAPEPTPDPEPPEPVDDSEPEEAEDDDETPEAETDDDEPADEDA